MGLTYLTPSTSTHTSPWIYLGTCNNTRSQRNAMLRGVPAVRALCERARRPVLMLSIALALMAPGGVIILRGGLVPSGASPGAMARAEPAAAPAAEVSAAALAWRVKAVERERQDAAAKFAAAFSAYKVPLHLAEEIHRAAEEEKIDPAVAFGLVRVESSFKRTAVSYAGAVGYTQVLPSTARWLVPGTTRSGVPLSPLPHRSLRRQRPPGADGVQSGAGHRGQGAQAGPQSGQRLCG
jgi:hypothetical protein